jgi:hypothetical protein
MVIVAITAIIAIGRIVVVVLVNKDEDNFIDMHFVYEISKGNDRNLGLIWLIVFLV